MYQTLVYKNHIAGVLGFNVIDHVNGIGHIGYWLGEKYNGRGIMTIAVRDLISLGFNSWPLQKVEIRCAAGNTKSRAIPERLGFRNEGTIRCAEKVNEKIHDHIIYGLLRKEFVNEICC